MKFEISIQGDELNELTNIVQEINGEETPIQITRDQYLENICMNFLTPRIRGVLVLEAMEGDIEDLKKKLGSIEELKLKHKNKVT